MPKRTVHPINGGPPVVTEFSLTPEQEQEKTDFATLEDFMLLDCERCTSAQIANAIQSTIRALHLLPPSFDSELEPGGGS